MKMQKDVVPPSSAPDGHTPALQAQFVGTGPGIHIRALPMMHIAMFDAINSIEDVYTPYLIEVNVTSVGALRKADALLGWTLCADLLDSVLGTQDNTQEKRRSA